MSDFLILHSECVCVVNENYVERPISQSTRSSNQGRNNAKESSRTMKGIPKRIRHFMCSHSAQSFVLPNFNVFVAHNFVFCARLLLEPLFISRP